jgi:hypothetical protein
LTLLKPRPDSDEEVRRLLEELDAEVAESPGLILSFIAAREQKLGRVSLWQSKQDANREATNDRTLSLRSRLRYLSVEAEESMMEVASGHLPEGLTDFFVGRKRSVAFSPAERQMMLPSA